MQHIPKCSLQESEGVFSCLHIKTGKFCTGVRTRERHDKEFIILNVRSRKNSLWKRKSVWTQIDLHKSWCQALPSFYTGRTCLFVVFVFFQALSKWAECISTTYRGGAGNWASVAVGKTGEWLHSIRNNVCQRQLEIPNPRCSSKQDYSRYWMGTAEALSHCVWPSSRSWSAMSSLNGLFHYALACLWDLQVAICSGQHTSWTKGGSMRCRQMNEEKQTNLQTSAAESYPHRFGIVWDRKDL